jgi:hypothetical protein
MTINTGVVDAGSSTTVNAPVPFAIVCAATGDGDLPVLSIENLVDGPATQGGYAANYGVGDGGSASSATATDESPYSDEFPSTETPLVSAGNGLAGSVAFGTLMLYEVNGSTTTSETVGFSLFTEGNPGTGTCSTVAQVVPSGS